MTARQRLPVVAVLAGFVLILGLVLLVVLIARDDDAATPGPTDTAPTGPASSLPSVPIPTGTGSTRVVPQTPGSLPPGVVPNLWPVDRRQAEQVTARFAVAFSTYMPRDSDSPRQWVDSLAPYSTRKYVTLAERTLNQHWWYLTSGGLGAENAKLVTMTPIWQRSESMMFRVVLDRTVRSFLGEARAPYTERVSWDIVVVGERANDPRVVGCLKADPRHDNELPEGEPIDV